jgi:tetratricopeptide (TPR) repeat protein
LARYRALDLDPAAHWTRYALARAYGEAGRTDEALAAFDALATDDRPYPATFGERAWLHLKAGRYAEAAGDIDRAIDALPDNDWWWGVRAMIRHGAGNAEAAAADARRAHALTGPGLGSMRVGFNRVLYQLLAGEDAAAAELARRLLAEGPGRRRLIIAAGELEVVAGVLPEPVTAMALLDTYNSIPAT